MLFIVRPWNTVQIECSNILLMDTLVVYSTGSSQYSTCCIGNMAVVATVLGGQW